MVQYALLIYTNEALYTAMPQAEQDADFQKYYDFTNEITKRGVNKGGEPLMPVSSATTLRIRDGKKTITDGPFAETKEQLAGFYLVECKDIEEALELAAMIPGAKYGSVEVRPLMVLPEQA